MMRPLLYFIAWCCVCGTPLMALPDISGQTLAGESSTNAPGSNSPLLPRFNDPRPAPLRVSGILETSSQFSLPALGSYAEETGIIKLEGRLRLNLGYNRGLFTARFVTDSYYYPAFQPDPAPRETSLLIRQGWIALNGERLSAKIGWQQYSWGNADLFPSVNPLDRQDFRDLSNLDRSQRHIGVFGLSSRLLTGATALNLVLIPATRIAALPEKDAFWRFSYDDIGGLTVTDTTGDASTPDFSTAAAALRWGGSVGGLDFHLNWYYGPQRGLLHRTLLIGSNATSAELVKQPVSKHVHLFAFNAAFTAGKAALRLELAFAPAMTALRTVSESDLTATNTLTPTNNTVLLNEPEHKPYLSWTVGMDIPLFGGDGRLLLEWKQDLYLSDTVSREAFRISDMLAILYSRSFAGGLFRLQTGAVLTRREGEILGAIGYQLTIRLSDSASLSQETLFLAGTAGLAATVRF